MNPVWFGIFKIFYDIKAEIVALVRKYIAGNASTGEIGYLKQYIGRVASNTTNTIKSGINDVIGATNIYGSVRIYSQAAGATIAVQPDVKLLSLSITVAGGYVSSLDVDGVSVAQLTKQNAIISTIGAVTHYKTDFYINSSWSTAVQILVNISAGTIVDTCVTFIQPFDMRLSGVIIS